MAADAMLAAQESIYIAAEFLSPELYLARDVGILQEYRLDVLLQRKAREGVLVRVSLAKSKFADFVAGRLELLHENIFVMIHNQVCEKARAGRRRK